MHADPVSLIRASAWLFAGAGLLGLWMATLRFAMGRPAPRLLSRLHGYFAAGGLGLLLYAAATTHPSRLAAIATVLLCLAALGGVFTAQVSRTPRWASSSEALVFGHLALAVSGYLLLVVAAFAHA